jgi:hypothetical protein
MVKEISKINRDTIRIHESGDFYNKYYLDKWFAIMRHFPDKTFLAYSKSVLDFSNKPDNFILFFSVDRTTNGNLFEWYRNNKYKNAMAHIGGPWTANCPGSCKSCDRCYKKDTVVDVVFKRH